MAGPFPRFFPRQRDPGRVDFPTFAAHATGQRRGTEGECRGRQMLAWLQEEENFDQFRNDHSVLSSRFASSILFEHEKIFPERPGTSRPPRSTRELGGHTRRRFGGSFSKSILVRRSPLRELATTVVVGVQGGESWLQ